ncbi:YhgE/Pip domain-containing protein [Paenibacillus rhizovicinus]|uniref:YhgE/Pip domain-containing protein n=2 Tax=Paenibacillus rhizovicinus TaxID=2704463 RepID=A0A6C0PC65_9BACL|nr:YhgE/Pip domain-containing protein [Paenibacillus rhizovicinus]
MKGFQVFTGEFRHFIRTPMIIVTFAAVALVPILYSGFLIRGTWDPYGQLADLPIAVVNEDQGAAFEGKPRQIGTEFVDELKSNEQFSWQFVNAGEAASGMKSNRYYGTITIPASFSADAASLDSDHPKQAEIEFESNSFNNFIAGQIGENAIKELRNRLSTTLTEAYSRTIFAQFETIATGFSDAGKGAGDLHEGARSLGDGIHKLKVNMDTLASGTSQASSGIGQLQTGANQLKTGASALGQGAGDLASGAKQLQDAGTKLEQGAASAITGSQTLSDGLRAFKNGADQLSAGLKTAADGSRSLETGLTASAAASADVADGAGEVASGLDQLASANPELAADAGFQKLLAASKAVAEGSKQLNAAQKQLLAGSKTLASGNGTLASGADTLSGSARQLAEGADQLHAGQQQLHTGLHAFNAKLPAIADGARKLSKGADQLNGGIGGLASGIGKLAAGVDKAADGAQQLDSGAAELDAGAPKLVDGSGRLADQLNEAASKTAAVKADDAAVQMLADPVKITSIDDRKVTVYGNGIAPYFISMSLYAGALVFTTIYAARGTRVAGATGPRLLVGKLLVFVIMSIVQSLIVCTVLLALLGLKVQHIPLFYLFTVVTGLTFMLIVQMLVTWLDQPGRFVVLVVMIFQLASSAGTFPLELLPGWAKAMHPWLPMSYSIQGLRDVISSGDFNRVWHQMGILSLFAAGALILTCVYFLTRKPEAEGEQLMPARI